MDYKKKIAENIIIEGIEKKEILSSLVFSQEQKNGEFSLPCFRLAKQLRKSPMQIADEIKAAFPPLSFIEKIETVAGYVNFFIKRKHFIAKVFSILESTKPKKRIPKTICIDFSSINIAKPFHIGHLLTTAIGGSLYRIFSYLGYTVIGINHLGDWGTQFGKLISAYKRWGSPEELKKDGIMALTKWYVRFHTEAENNKSLEDEGREYFKKIEDGDPEALTIFENFKAITLKEVEQVYQRLGIKFDSYNGESFFSDKISSVIELLKQKNLLTSSENAQVVDLQKYDMPPCLILKSDGASLYATRDLAAAIYRKNEYSFNKNLYVVAYQQNLHFQQVFKVLELCGFAWAKDCIHVPFGMVSLEGGKSLSTRKGSVIYLIEVINTAVEKAKKIIEEKNPSIKNKDQISEAVGVGAVVFSALNTSRIKDVVFSYDRALNFDGETAPYLQYTHVRCSSILEKASNNTLDDSSLLQEASAFELVRLLYLFDYTVLAAAQKYEPSLISTYLISLAKAFNSFYAASKVIGSSSRIRLTKAVKNTLKKGLELLLINAPEKM